MMTTSPDLNSATENDRAAKSSARGSFWIGALIVSVVVLLLGAIGIWKSNNFIVVERLDNAVCTGTIDGEPLVAELNFQPHKDILALIAFADGRHWSLTAHRVEAGQHQWSLLDPASHIVGTLQGDWQAATGRFRGEMQYATPQRATAKVELNRIATFERTTQVSGLRMGPFGHRFKGVYLTPRFSEASPFRDLEQQWTVYANNLPDLTTQIMTSVELLTSNFSIPDDEFLAQFTISYCDSQMLSIKTHTSENSGGAHGSWSNHLETWIATGSEVTPFVVEDSLPSAQDVPNWKPLNELIYRHLNAEKTKRGIAHFTPPNPELTDVPDCTFACEPAGLRVNFAPYSVGAYAEGDYEFVIPWSEVRPAFRRDSPAQRFWKSFDETPGAP